MNADILKHYLLMALGDDIGYEGKREIHNFCEDLEKLANKTNECHSYIDKGIAPYRKEKEAVEKEFRLFKNNFFDKCFYFDMDGKLLVNSAKVLELFGDEAKEWKEGD